MKEKEDFPFIRYPGYGLVGFQLISIQRRHHRPRVQHLMQQKASAKLRVCQEDGSQQTLGKTLVVETMSYISLT